jgi:hypothetical protein
METVSMICLAGARKEAGRDKDLAEKLYRRAIRACSQETSPVSPHVGLILDEFASFLEAHNRDSEASHLYIQIHAVLRDCFQSFSFATQAPSWHPSGTN